MAVRQARDPGSGRTYYLRKSSEGKTPAEARRALNRRPRHATLGCPCGRTWLVTGAARP